MWRFPYAESIGVTCAKAKRSCLCVYLGTYFSFMCMFTLKSARIDRFIARWILQQITRSARTCKVEFPHSFSVYHFPIDNLWIGFGNWIACTVYCVLSIISRSPPHNEKIYTQTYGVVEEKELCPLKRTMPAEKYYARWKVPLEAVVKIMTALSTNQIAGFLNWGI